MSYAKYAKCPSYPALCEAEKLRGRMKARRAAFSFQYHSRKVEELVAKCEAELGGKEPVPVTKAEPAPKPKFGARKAPVRRRSPVEVEPPKAKTAPELVVKTPGPSTLSPGAVWDGEKYVPAGRVLPRTRIDPPPVVTIEADEPPVPEEILNEPVTAPAKAEAKKAPSGEEK